MRKSITAIALAAAMLPATAQLQAEGGKWTLDQCISYALEHNLTVKARDLDVSSGQLNVNSAKNRFLPTVSASAQQNFSFGRSVAEDNLKVSSNASSFGWSANAQVPLFQGLGNLRNLRTANLSLQNLVLLSDAARDDVTLNVISAYLQVLLADELAGVARSQVELARSEVARQEQLVDAGKVPELDLIQARSQLAQDELTLVDAQGNSTLALTDLRQLLLLPDSEPFGVVPLGSQTILIPDADEVYRSAMTHNSSILAKRQAIKLADSRVALAKSGWWPTLSLGASVGSSYTHFKALSSNPFSQQMRDNLQEAVGFTLSVPLFDAFSTRNSVRSAKIDRLMAEVELEESASALQKSITQAYVQAETARKKAEASQVAEDATKAALEAVTTKLNFGKGTFTEYQQAKNDYVRACSATIQARYEYMVRAKILEFYNTPHSY